MKFLRGFKFQYMWVHLFILYSCHPSVIETFYGFFPALICKFNICYPMSILVGKKVHVFVEYFLALYIYDLIII